MRRTTLILLLLFATSVFAQQSASFRIEESHIISGGHPLEDGSIPTSSRFRITLDAIGSGMGAADLTAATLLMTSGFVGSVRPPGVVENLIFVDPVTMVWDADPSTGDYAIYRGTITTPFDAAYGTCIQPPPPVTGTTASLTDVPAMGQALFVLVTARNRLNEEGIKGFTSSGGVRAIGTPCL